LRKSLPEKYVELEQIIDDTQKEKLAAFKDFHLNHLRACDIYYNKKYEKPESVMEFQTLWLEQQFYMENNPEFFCKSAEDRTGRVNNILEEREVYRTLKGHLPHEDAEREEINRTISPIINDVSASYSNTKANSESPHLQIGSQVNSHLDTKPRKQSARFSKI